MHGEADNVMVQRKSFRRVAARANTSVEGTLLLVHADIMGTAMRCNTANTAETISAQVVPGFILNEACLKCHCSHSPTSHEHLLIRIGQ